MGRLRVVEPKSLRRATGAGLHAAMTKQNQPSLAGQVAAVTGSAQGIGAGIALKLAAHGARVIIHGREKEKETAEKVRKSIQEIGGEAIIVLGDLRGEVNCRNVVRGALEHFGRLDILVNNAGVVHRGTIESTSVELWDEILDTNLRAPFILSQEAVKHMKERRSGCIINIGSVNAHHGLKKILAYSASKGGLMTFTKNLANYLTQYRIRVNQINPGWVLTEGEHVVNIVVEGKGENWLEEAVKTRPFGRMLLPEDIANAALFFASNELISGAVLDFEQLPFGVPTE
jgi:NAD(P)-dependent dehydrogenase (short-subunit alcohol dehydrogenase family)